MSDRDFWLTILRGLLAIANAIVKRHLAGVKLVKIVAEDTEQEA